MREAGWYDRNGQRKPELPAQAGAPLRPVQTCVRPPPSILHVPVTVWMRTDEPDVFVEVDQIRLERARVKGGARFRRLRRGLRAERRRKDRDYEAHKCIPAEKAARGTERLRTVRDVARRRVCCAVCAGNKDRPLRQHLSASS